MNNLAQLVSEKYKGQVYDEAAVEDFIEEQGYVVDEIEISFVPVELINTTVKRMKRFTMTKETRKYTLFIAIDDMDNCNYVYFRDGYVYDLNEVMPKESAISTTNPDERSANVVALFIIGAVGSLMLFGVISLFQEMLDSNNDDPVYNYYDKEDYNEYDDYDSDGDNDFDDTVKYFEDSLEEDKYDGDDGW